jgi:hypothetical protein
MADNLSPTPTPPADTGTSNTVTNVSGGVSIAAQHDIIIGGDVIGRDKITVSPRDKNLTILMQKVKDFWVKGLLEDSVHHAALIELGKHVKPDVVEVDHPWASVVQTPDKPDYTLPPEAKTIDVFDEMQGALLILGEPGSGKTTTLLELARDLIARAEKDSSQPVPVYFNLSSWASKRKAIDKWLVDELKEKYFVTPVRIIEKWLIDNELILLLDGLDEVQAENLKGCVEAINKFHEEHGLVRMVVCSRVEEYMEPGSQLKFDRAIQVQSLSREQIECYITACGPLLAPLGAAIQADAYLQEFAQSPFMLSIMSLAFSGQSIELSSPEADDGTLDWIFFSGIRLPQESWNARLERARREKREKALQKHCKPIFDAYVEKMFDRSGRTKRTPYSKDKTIRWLTWLAARMSKNGESIFLLEQMQPSWLTSSSGRDAIAFLEMLFSLLFAGLIGMLFGSSGGFSGEPFATVVRELGLNQMNPALLGLLIGVILVLGPYMTDESSKTSYVQKPSPDYTRWFNRLRGGLGLGIVLGAIVGFLVGLRGAFVCWGGLAVGFVFGLLALLYWPGNYTFFGKRTKPDQAIRRSARIGLIAALFGGLSLALFASWVVNQDVLAVELGYELRVVVLTGLISALIVGSTFGGGDFFHHSLVRFFMWTGGHGPLNYVRFLDYAAERILLRKVGGGYIFIHRMLQEYFAELEEQPDAQGDK